MKIKIKKLMAAVLPALGVVVSTSSAFAANPYGIQYSGGEPLSSSNVQVNPELLEGLTPLIKWETSNDIVFSNSRLWENGYMLSNGNCVQGKYFKVSKDNNISEDSNLWYTIANDSYTIKVQFNKLVIDGVVENMSDEESAVIFIFSNRGHIGAGYKVFSDSTCETPVENIKGITIASKLQMFVQTNIKLFDKTNDSILKSNNLYFGLADIDAAQSYKILNQNNLLTKSNMYAVSSEALQPPEDLETDLRNMYVSSGNYIYSEYDDSGFNSEETNNIFVKVNPDVEEDGLDVVFGYANPAASGVQYYAKQYVIKYESDENGEVSGIEEEDIVSSDTPTGSTSEANEGYEFDYWIASADVTLGDGTVIKAGKPITPAQVKQVIVDEDITFIAIHKSTVKVPDTGSYTGETNAALISVSVFGIALGAFILGFAPKMYHKKMNFKK